MDQAIIGRERELIKTLILRGLQSIQNLANRKSHKNITSWTPQVVHHPQHLAMCQAPQTRTHSLRLSTIGKWRRYSPYQKNPDPAAPQQGGIVKGKLRIRPSPRKYGASFTTTSTASGSTYLPPSPRPAKTRTLLYHCQVGNNAPIVKVPGAIPTTNVPQKDVTSARRLGTRQFTAINHYGRCPHLQTPLRTSSTPGGIIRMGPFAIHFGHSSALAHVCSG